MGSATPGAVLASARSGPLTASGGVAAGPRDSAPGFSPEWTALSGEIAGCSRCALHRSRTHVVVYRGSPAPRVVFVGEAPGAAEDQAGIPFVGRSGRRLDAAIEHVGLKEGEFGVLNLLKCRPPDNRFDRVAEGRCRPFLDRQIALLRPRVIVTLGAHALRALDPNAPPITTVAGRPRPTSGPELFPLLHPAAALHAPRLRARWSEDLDRLRAHLARSAG